MRVSWYYVYAKNDNDSLRKGVDDLYSANLPKLKSRVRIPSPTLNRNSIYILKFIFNTFSIYCGVIRNYCISVILDKV